MYWLLLIPVILVLLYLFCLKGRTHHPKLRQLRESSYAHRGLHNQQLPENSMGAFQKAVECGFGAELDVHLLKDGSLAVFHDSDLMRMTGRAGRIEDLTAAELREYHLAGTEETIPLFSDVLALFEGKQPLIVELKSAGGNYGALCKAACQLLDQYHVLYCMESFDPRCVLWLRKHRPEIVRGQLSENWLKSKAKLPWIAKWVMTCHLANMLTRPDFVAYKYADRNTLGTRICRRLWKIQGVSWTLKTREEYDTAVGEGWIPIFENFIP